MATGVGAPLDRVKSYEDGTLADAAYPGQGRQCLAAALTDHDHAIAGLVLPAVGAADTLATYLLVSCPCEPRSS